MGGSELDALIRELGAQEPLELQIRAAVEPIRRLERYAYALVLVAVTCAIYAPAFAAALTRVPG